MSEVFSSRGKRRFYFLKEIVLDNEYIEDAVSKSFLSFFLDKGLLTDEEYLKIFTKVNNNKINVDNPPRHMDVYD